MLFCAANFTLSQQHFTQEGCPKGKGVPAYCNSLIWSSGTKFPQKSPVDFPCCLTGRMGPGVLPRPVSDGDTRMATAAMCLFQVPAQNWEQLNQEEESSSATGGLLFHPRSLIVPVF